VHTFGPSGSPTIRPVKDLQELVVVDYRRSVRRIV
jgi:hypothetical protein